MRGEGRAFSLSFDKMKTVGYFKGDKMATSFDFG